MAAGDLITGDWELEYNGVLMGDGTPFLIAEIEGLLDLPDITSADTMRLRRHGLRAGDDFAQGRTITVTVEVTSTDTVTFNEAIDQLMLASTPGGNPIPLVFQIPGVAGSGKRAVWCRPRQRSLPIGREFYYELPLAVIEFYSVDPRIESSVLGTDSTTLPTAGGGLNFNATAPFTFGAVSVGGTLNLANDGNFDASPDIVITGPVTNPSIESITQDKTLSFAITLAVGETLVIDTEQRTVMLNGTASRYSTLDTDAEWFTLQPGNNEVRFQAATTTAATMQISWRSAWV